VPAHDHRHEFLIWENWGLDSSYIGKHLMTDTTT
jgi:hypothetical protein